MKELDEMTIYDVVDVIKDRMTAEELAEYLWKNYPKYSEELMEHVKARMYLDIMDAL